MGVPRSRRSSNPNCWSTRYPQTRNATGVPRSRRSSNPSCSDYACQHAHQGRRHLTLRITRKKSSSSIILNRRRAIYPCYHFFSLISHKISLIGSPQTLSAITGGTCRSLIPTQTRCAAQKPSSFRFLFAPSQPAKTSSLFPLEASL